MVDLRPFEDRIVARAEFIIERAEEFSRSRAISPAEVRFRLPAARFAAEAYFLISEAYKHRRLRPGARTQEPKIAAIMSLAISSVQPYYAMHPFSVKCSSTYVANQNFSLYCATLILNNDFSKLSNDSIRRGMNFLLNARMPCIGEYIVDVSIGAKRSRDVYDIELTDSELSVIDIMILVCELLYNPQL